MAIDPAAALAAPPTTREIAWTRRDVLLYHLSLGAGARADVEPELPYTYEANLQVLPTFALVAGQGISAGDRGAPGLALPGIDVDLRKILHAGQALEVHCPLPASGTATVSNRVTAVRDKGRAALIVLESTAVDHTGAALWTTTMQIWARGEGGFGGDPGPEVSAALPEREPDAVLNSPTAPDQALRYRLNGDMNPLHADPGFARTAGFERPILHGLATYGLVAKAIVDGLLDGDATRLRVFSARFAGTLLPGETIRTEVWRESDRLALRSTCPERDGAPVLTHATAEVTA
ncbi:MaoC family dehydratase N-terminal domain-containing protein [Saccharopolyspora indica]|uniref:MaoC/PaaZ C-terminal domain-containing protein n=1 Tax=Saccharopolyspora indica TaxID=1229659 RepID=UPI0022EAFE02|nr:MaoC/PaaZ C-terminal domain-containing protein [Saccharopolyspora indica]MDA3649656.1 MaoC/PaaZ C-terminal domain-containing protein [Saccharopolyspora indica]